MSNYEQDFMFAIINDNGKSTRGWALRVRDSDMYLMPQAENLAGAYKISIHESGVVQFAVTSSYCKELGMPEESRAGPRYKCTGNISLACGLVFPMSRFDSTQDDAQIGTVFLKACKRIGSAVAVFVRCVAETPISRIISKYDCLSNAIAIKKMQLLNDMSIIMFLTETQKFDNAVITAEMGLYTFARSLEHPGYGLSTSFHRSMPRGSITGGFRIVTDGSSGVSFMICL